MSGTDEDEHVRRREVVVSTVADDVLNRPMPLPLQGLRVLDLNEGVAPLCGQMLALLGAEVVTPSAPVRPQARDEVERLAYSLGTTPITLDLSGEGGQRAVQELITRADVLINGMEGALGTLVDEIAAEQARLIHLRVTPFGLTGPRAGWRATELIAQAAGGLLFISGAAEFPPAMLGVPVGACAAGMQGLVAVLLALRLREQTGMGTLIDLSVQEAVANLLFKVQSEAYVNKVADRRGTIQSGGRTGLWQCQDGYVTWTLWTGPGWGRKNLPLIEWMNEEGEGLELREVPWEELSLFDLDRSQLARWESIFARFFRRFSKRRLAEEAVRRRFLLYPINTMSEVVADAQLEARGVFVPVQLPDGRSVRAVGRPFRSTAYDLRLPVRVPGRPIPAQEVLARWRDGGSRGERFHQLGRSTLAEIKAPPSQLPLTGVRVLDFSWLVAGPVMTKYLAFYGADVVKVESRKRPDASRMTGPYPLGRPGMDGSALFANVSASKRSIGLDLTHPDARNLLLRLGGVADLVVENFTPGTLDRHGLGYADFRSVNPGIIMVSLSLQGQTGPRAMQPGLGSHLQALCGLDDLTGFPDGPPGGPNQVMPDLIGPWFGLAAVLAALEHRRRTGEGQYIDISQYETIMMYMQPAVLRAQLDGTPPRRNGNRSPHACPHGVYPTIGDDAWIALAVTNDEEWRRLWDLLPGEARRSFGRESTLAERLARVEALDAAIAAWTVTKDGPALAEELQARGIPAYPVNNGLMLLSDPQLGARRHYHFPRHELIGTVPVDDAAFRIPGLEPRVAPGPRYASATADVLREWLGLDDEEIAQLLVSGVITFD
jgi:crotonobetainyl-CoA:carnitine CoA-transferase CaiB-like acyl-CoA transferase